MNKIKDSVKREVVVNAPLEKIWDALTKPEHLNRWYTKEAEIDFRVGGKGFMNHGWGATSEGVFTEIDIMQRFVLQSPDGDFTTVTSLEEVDEGIKVSIEYQASFIGEMDAASKENMLFGTGQFLENLKSVYEKGTDIRNMLWRTWIGIAHSTNPSPKGTKVLQVKDGSNAALAGVVAGDVITKIDGESVHGYESFERMLNTKAVDISITLELLRGKEELELTCEVGAYPVAY